MNCFLSIILVFWALTGCGCAVVKYSEGLNTLKRLSLAGEEIETYVMSQEKGFCRLQEDAAAGAFPGGLSKTEFIDNYGDPVFCRPVADAPQAAEVLLYRHPTGFFDSDRFYVYFDDNEKLSSWKHVPAR